MKGRLERTALTQSLQIILLSEPAVEKGRRTTGMQQTILDRIYIDTWFPLKVALSERCKDHKNANGSQRLPESEFSSASPPPYHKSESELEQVC